jgi:hypothetical protein
VNHSPPEPRDKIVAGRTVTKELNDEFNAADETLSEILDGLVLQLKDTNAKFVSDYNNARIIVDQSASHASAMFFCERHARSLQQPRFTLNTGFSTPHPGPLLVRLGERELFCGTFSRRSRCASTPG